MRIVRFLVLAALALSLVVNIVLYRKYRSGKPILVVNGEAITKKDLLDYLEQQGGIGVKKLFVERMMTDQEAKKQGVVPTQQEVDEIFDHERELKPEVAQAVAYNPFAMDQTKANIRFELEKARLLAKPISISDDEIKAKYAEQSSNFDNPDKAKVELAMITDASKVDDVAELMRKNPPVEPATIERTFQGRVRFYGDKGIYTFARPFGQTATNPNGVFTMKDGEVRILDPGAYSQQGIKKIVVRRNSMINGSKVDPNDPKIKERIRLALALERAKPWDEMLSEIWKNTELQSESPDDKKYIEMLMFPDRARSTDH